MAAEDKKGTEQTQVAAPSKQEGGVSERGTVVGISQSKKLLVFLFSALVAGLMFYFAIFQGNDYDQEKPKKQSKSKEAVEKALKETAKSGVTATEEDEYKPGLPMQLPSLPELSIPEPPKPPPPPPSTNSGSDFNPFDFSKVQQGQDAGEIRPIAPKPSLPLPPPVNVLPSPVAVAPPAAASLNPKLRTERRSASMFAFGGKGSKDKEGAESADRVINVNSALNRTGAAQTANSYYGDRAHMMAQGKMIEIILETAIDTDLKGLLRGIVSRDVFSESGNNILIPKGSRAIGTYSASLGSGQTRVAVVWNRIMRPDGIDVMLDMPSTDKQGRAGVSGEVDYHMAEVMRNALLVSMLTIASGVILTEIFNDNTVTQTVNTTDGAVTTASSAAYTETQGAIDDVLSKLRTSLDRTESTTQTIRIHSGTVVKAFVRQDVIFVGDTAFAYSAASD